MPWITVTVPGASSEASPLPANRPDFSFDASGLTTDLAHAVADAAGLAADDVVVLVVLAAAAAGRGAVVTVAGRRRSPDVELAVRNAIRRLVATTAGLTPDLVSITRLSTESLPDGEDPGNG